VSGIVAAKYNAGGLYRTARHAAGRILPAAWRARYGEAAAVVADVHEVAFSVKSQLRRTRILACRWHVACTKMCWKSGLVYTFFRSSNSKEKSSVFF
jgi:hypothetical protein